MILKYLIQVEDIKPRSIANYPKITIFHSCRLFEQRCDLRLGSQI